MSAAVANEAGIFTYSELPVAVITSTVMAMLIRVRDNHRAVLWNMGLVIVGLAGMGVATAAFQYGLFGPVAWMVAVGAGIYLAYTPFNALLFDRVMAAAARRGNAGFLIYVADACGYCGSVTLLLARNFGHISLRWTSFLSDAAYATCMIGLIATAFALYAFCSRRSFRDRRSKIHTTRNGRLFAGGFGKRPPS